MKRVIICILLFYVVGVSADDAIPLIRQAEVYFEAKDYNKAQQLFQKLQGEKLQPWQKARLTYNIGTIDLEKGDWKAAGLQFNEIPYFPNQAPMLSRALKTNVAVMQFREGMQLFRKGELSLEEYSKIFYLFREALNHVQEAQQAECFLEEKMGLDRCREAQDLAELRSVLKKELAFTAKRYGEAKISESSPKEGIPYLLSGINLAEAHVEFLQGKNLEADLKKKYLKLFTRDIESWLLLWEAQTDKEGELADAYQQYRLGLEKMKNEDFSGSRLAFLSSEALLSDLMRKMWGIDPFAETLRKLLASYQRALDQAPIQIPSLYQIQTEQLKVREITELSQISLEKFDASSNYLKQSIEYARQAKNVWVRFYLEEAKQLLRRLLRQKPEIADAPLSTLQNAIEEQAHALGQFRLAMKIGTAEEKIETLMRQSQKTTLMTAEPFLAEVMAKEIAEYPVRCQCVPWDQVLPLFDKGKQAAERAAELMQQKDSSPLLVMANQEEALRYWREALDKLLHPEEKKKEKEQQEKEEPEPQPQPQEKTDIKEVLQLLQAMDQEDRRPESGGTPPKEGTRPW